MALFVLFDLLKKALYYSIHTACKYFNSLNKEYA